MLPGEKYHLFNHANGRENIFTEPKNYAFFLQKLATHILPVCKLFCYCLMPNHFHLVLEVRCEEELFLLWQKPGSVSKLNQKALEHKISKVFGIYSVAIRRQLIKFITEKAAYLFQV